MTDARLEPMGDADLAAWRAARSAERRPLPSASEGEDLTAHEVYVDDVAIGGALLGLLDGRCSVRELQTTLPPEADAAWAALIAALERGARKLGADHVVTGTTTALSPHFDRAGFGAVMTALAKRLGSPDELQQDRRVVVRPMTAEERASFVVDAQAFMEAGTARSGVGSQGAAADDVAQRLHALVEEPPAHEMLVTGTLDGTPVARLWTTLRPRADGGTDLLGHALDVFPAYRGQGLTRSFLGAVRRHLHERGVTDVYFHLFGYDTGLRDLFVGAGMHAGDVWLRKDL